MSNFHTRLSVKTIKNCEKKRDGGAKSMHTRMCVRMINIANRHPKLHFFQVVTDFMKTNVQ